MAQVAEVVFEPVSEDNAVMSRTYLTFGDIASKLHTLRIECTRCARKGRYNVAKLVSIRHGAGPTTHSDQQCLSGNW